MFDDLVERQAKIDKIHETILVELQISTNQFRKIFYNKDSARINKEAFIALSEKYKFQEVSIDIKTFSIKDLLKISMLNNDLVYIDIKKSKIYTCDVSFINWCKIMSCNINAIRNLE